MTVSTTEYIARYTGSSPTVTFAFPYKFLEDDDLIVSIYNPTTYVTTLQTEGTDYTVTGAGLDNSLGARGIGFLKTLGGMGVPGWEWTRRV